MRFYETKTTEPQDRELSIYRIKMHSLPPITFYRKIKETKIELLLNWDAYEKPIPLFRDAYAVVGKLALELCLGKKTFQVTTIAQLINAPIKFTNEEFNKILDTEWKYD